MYRRRNQPAATTQRKRTREHARLLQMRRGRLVAQAALGCQRSTIETTDFRSAFFRCDTMAVSDGNSNTDAKVPSVYCGLRCARNWSRALDDDCERHPNVVANSESRFVIISGSAICAAAPAPESFSYALCNSVESNGWSEIIDR
jgi:hypothetical protein